jgi:hypothetical protein
VSAGPDWVVVAGAPVDTATAAQAARTQASLAHALTRLRAVRFPLVPAPVEPATGDRAAEYAAARATRWDGGDAGEEAG